VSVNTGEAMLTRVLRLLTPPIIPAVARHFSAPPPSTQGSPPHFDEAGLAMFRKHAAAAGSYAEYGCGGSTRFVLDNTKATVASVDTSAEWVECVRKLAGPNSGRLDITAVDVGPLGDWGTPLGYSRRDNFRTYVELPLSRARQPDVVLVDGRFRVASFLHALLSTRAGTTILFDDYSGRPEYHLVEEICRPAERTERMVRFVTPESFDRAKATALEEAFTMVWQ